MDKGGGAKVTQRSSVICASCFYVMVETITGFLPVRHHYGASQRQGGGGGLTNHKIYSSRVCLKKNYGETVPGPCHSMLLRKWFLCWKTQLNALATCGPLEEGAAPPLAIMVHYSIGRYGLAPRPLLRPQATRGDCVEGGSMLCVLCGSGWLAWRNKFSGGEGGRHI
jgi:hypothetical protein